MFITTTLTYLKGIKTSRFPTSLRTAGFLEEEQQHAADDEHRANDDGCKRGKSASFLDMLLFPCIQIQEEQLVMLVGHTHVPQKLRLVSL